MQINSVLPASSGVKTPGTKSSKGGFGDLLNDIEQNGSLTVMQLLAGGFVFPQQMMQGEIMQNGGQQGNSQSQQASGKIAAGAVTPDLTGTLVSGQTAVAQTVLNSGIQVQSSQGIFGLKTCVPQNLAVNLEAQGILSQGPNVQTQSNAVQNTAAQANPLQSVQGNPSDGTFLQMTQQAPNAQPETASPPISFSAQIIGRSAAVQNPAGQAIKAEDTTKTPEVSGSATDNTAQGTLNYGIAAQNLKTALNNTAVSADYAQGGISTYKTQVQPAAGNAADAQLAKTGTAVQKDASQFGQVLATSQNAAVKASPAKNESTQSDLIVQTAQAVSHGAKKASDGAQSDSSSQSGGNGSGGVSDYQAVAASQSSAAGKTEFSLQADKANVSEQVASAVKQAVDTGRQEIRLHLSPEDLGGISIKIVSQDGTLSMQITADNAHTGQLISSGMHELSQSMQNHGLSLGKTEVTYSQGDSSGAFSGSQQQQADRKNSGSKAPVWNLMQNTVSEPEKSTETVKSGRISILA